MINLHFGTFNFFLEEDFQKSVKITKKLPLMDDLLLKMQTKGKNICPMCYFAIGAIIGWVGQLYPYRNFRRIKGDSKANPRC
jgi:hypothetical protein